MSRNTWDGPFDETDMTELAAMRMRNTKGAIYMGPSIPAEELRIAVDVLRGTYSRELDHAEVE